MVVSGDPADILGQCSKSPLGPVTPDGSTAFSLSSPLLSSPLLFLPSLR